MKKTKIIIILTILLFIFIGVILCIRNSVSMNDKYIFNDLLSSEIRSYLPVNTECIVSPNGKFIVELANSNLDDTSIYSLALQCNETNEKIMVGYSSRGILANWVDTQAGNLLVIKNLINTHENQLFIVLPTIDKNNGKCALKILYATPDSDLPIGITTTALDHVYPDVDSISYNGVATISILWDFTDGQSGKMCFSLPLFLSYINDKNE